MTDNFKPLQTQAFTLAGSGCLTGATSITLTSMLQIDGTTKIAMTDFGTKGFATIEPANGTREEQISFTGITQNTNGTATLTGVSNVLFASPYTETSGVAQSHPGGVVLVISNTSGFYNTYLNKNDDATIVGKMTFPGGGDANAPVSGTVYAAPTADLEYASKKYVDNVAVAGAPNATTGVKGIVQLATQAQVDAGTATGSTGASLTATPDLFRSRLLSDYVADTGTANTYAIAPSPVISAYATGQIFSFKATNANSGASTLNVNGKGAKNIYKLGSTALASGDIAAGQLVLVEYDGTQFQMLQPIANAPLTSASLKFGGTGADGALSITSGTTTINCAGAAMVTKNYTSISITGTGALAFSNPASTGTIIILKSQGNVTLTSSAAPMIDVSKMGAAGGAAAANTSGSVNGNDGTDGAAFYLFGTHKGTAGLSAPTAGTGGAVTTAIAPSSAYITDTTRTLTKYGAQFWVGAGGGSGAGAGAADTRGTTGKGGNGGGGLIIECGGALNFTTTSGISVAGENGGNGVYTSGTHGTLCGGGGGAGGFAIVLYNSLTAATGTITVLGGTGGTNDATGGSSCAGGGGGANVYSAGSNGAVSSTGSAKTGGDGGVGFSVITQNNNFA